MIILSYAAVYLIWGSTYYAIRVGIESMGPSLMLGTRFLGGALGNLALYAILERGKEKGLNAESLRNAAFVGVVLLIGGTGMVAYAEKTVSSHMAAVIIASMPFWVSLWEGMWKKQWVLTRRQMIGMVIGLIGVGLLMGKGEATGNAWQMDRVGMGFLAAAIFCWSFASAYSHIQPMPSAPFLNGAIQMAMAGVVFLAWGWWIGDVNWEAIRGASVRSWWAVGYLAVFGSTIAFTAFAWLMRVEPPTRVASYALVNPLVAILIGAWLGHETVSLMTLGGLACVLCGLWLHLRS